MLRRRTYCIAKYVTARMNGANQADAARASGLVGPDAKYGPAAARGSEFEHLPEVKRKIEEINAARISAAETGPDFVRGGLAVEAVTAGEAASRVRALELLGKLNGQFIDRSVSITASLSDAQLLDLLGAQPGLEFAEAAAGALTPLPAEMADDSAT